MHFSNVCLWAPGWSNTFSNMADATIINIHSRNGIFALWFLGFFFDGKDTHVFIEFHHTETFWVWNFKCKDTTTFFKTLDIIRKIVVKEDIITQNHCNIIFTNKIFTNNESFWQTLRFILNFIS